VVYVCGYGRLHEVTKNWALARTLLGVLGTTLGLRILVVGRHGADGVTVGRGRLDVVGELPWVDLMQCVARSRLALFPNTTDPSPRLLAEALCLDVPVLVNRNILGGWKYVASATGAFFSNEVELLAGARALLDGAWTPRDWFAARFGPRRAGERLATFLATLDC
jgi:glycosyltransferase involved in cell wall biosynthesis